MFCTWLLSPSPFPVPQTHLAGSARPVRLLACGVVMRDRDGADSCCYTLFFLGRSKPKQVC